MKKRILSLLLISLFVLSLAAGCQPGKEPDGSQEPGSSMSAEPNGGDSQEPVKIGFLGNLAGVEAYIGQSAKLALEDYIAELNAEGGLLGRQLELISYDYSIDPATEALTATNRFIEQDKVVAIIGPSGSQPAIPMAPVVEAAKVPVITTSATNPKVTVDETTGELYPYMFRVCFIDPYQGTALADFAYKQGITKVAVMAAIGDPYADGMAQYFTEKFTDLGGEIVASMGYQRNDIEFRALLSDAGTKGAKAIFMPATVYRDAGLAATQAKDLGLDFTFLFGDGIYSQELLDVAEGALDGSFMTNGVTEDDPAFEEFRNEFAAKHPGQSANIYVYYALDAMMLLEWAIREAGSFDGEAIKNKLETAVDVPAFTEAITIEPETHNPHNKSVTILKIVDNKYEVFETFKPED